MYEMACERLDAAGVKQYEISNFARQGMESRHNLKYWTRQPYLGFGVDAHSMLRHCAERESVRFSSPDTLEEYVAGDPLARTPVSPQSALEETFFLGLRLTDGCESETGRGGFRRAGGSIAGHGDLGMHGDEVARTSW